MAWRRIDVHRATERGDVAVLKRYLDSGGDAEKKDKEYGASPVHWAALRGRLEALSLLLERGGNLESRTGTDGTPLVWGCMGGNAPIVRYLLERGANISAITKGKGTALHHATHSGYPEVVSLLLEKGANPKAQDNRGERPGEKFDPEVSEGNRRAIAKALAKATRGSFTSKRGSSSRSKRHPTHESREGQRPPSSLVPNGDGSHRNGGGGGGSADGDAEMNGHPQTENEALSAAAAAVAAAAWTPKSPSKRPRPVAAADPGGGVFASVDRNLSASRQSSADVDARATRRSGTAIREAAAGAGAGGDENGGRLSPSSPLVNGADNYGGRGGGPAATVSPESSSSFLGLDDLRRRVKDVALAAARAEDRDAESRASVRRVLAEADERAQAAGAADRARSEMLGALVEALEQRLRDKEEQVDKLIAQLEDSNSRLRYREQEVLDLRGRVEGLPSSDTPGATPAAAEAAAAAAAEAAAPPPTTSHADRPPGNESSVPPPSAATEEEEGRGGEIGGSVSGRRAALRTRSSPTLSPTSEARFRSAGTPPESGEDYWPPVSSQGGREALDAGGGGGDIGLPGGGGGGGGGGSRRITIGPGTAASADDSFGYALESLAARDGGGGGGGALQAGVLGWWRRGEWGEESSAGPVKSRALQPPAPAVVEDQERLGSLYSMIARR